MQTGIIGLGVMGKPIAQHLHKGCDELALHRALVAKHCALEYVPGSSCPARF